MYITCHSWPVSYTHLSPISSILAEVFLQHLEKTKILTNNDRHSHKILYWHRHIDDILILYRWNKRQCEHLLTHINKIHKNITFTAEYEHNNTINFLDLSITKLEHKHKFSKMCIRDSLLALTGYKRIATRITNFFYINSFYLHNYVKIKLLICIKNYNIITFFRPE